MLRLSRFAKAAAFTFVLDAGLPQKTLAEPPPSSPVSSPWFIQMEAGPAFATFLPIDAGGITEHNAISGSQIAAGAGYGFDFGRIRLDPGLRVQHLHLQVVGSYSLVDVNDTYHSNYDYLAILLDVGAASRLPGRVNGFAGFALGTARHFSDRQGQPLRNHQLPFYGSIEAGLLIRLTTGMDLQCGLSWVPPVANLNVFAPVLGLRVEL
jgi:hypothetical protein